MIYFCETCGYWSDMRLAEAFMKAFSGELKPPQCKYDNGAMRLLQPYDRISIKLDEHRTQPLSEDEMIPKATVQSLLKRWALECSASAHSVRALANGNKNMSEAARYMIEASRHEARRGMIENIAYALDIKLQEDQK